MTKAIILVLIVLGSIWISGCAGKERIVIQKEYIYEQPYKFSFMDTKGLYIDLESKKIQRLCSPKMVELNNKWKSISTFYLWQIKEYTKEIHDNERER